MWVKTLCPLSSSTRNMAFGRGSTTEPSTSIASFFATLQGILRRTRLASHDLRDESNEPPVSRRPNAQYTGGIPPRPRSRAGPAGTRHLPGLSLPYARSYPTLTVIVLNSFAPRVKVTVVLLFPLITFRT